MGLKEFVALADYLLHSLAILAAAHAFLIGMIGSSAAKGDMNKVRKCIHSSFRANEILLCCCNHAPLVLILGPSPK
jgi:hypothetical protein